MDQDMDILERRKQVGVELSYLSWKIDSLQERLELLDRQRTFLCKDIRDLSSIRDSLISHLENLEIIEPITLDSFKRKNI